MHKLSLAHQIRVTHIQAFQSCLSGDSLNIFHRNRPRNVQRKGRNTQRATVT
jgi:hypothetical protein